MGDVGAETKTLASNLGDAWSKVDAAAKVRSRADLKDAVTEGLASFEKAKDSVTGRLQGMSASDALSMLGLDQKFVESELQLVESIAQGKAIENHLEPSYFEPMRTALDAQQGESGRA